jgi:hypothetical protein
VLINIEGFGIRSVACFSSASAARAEMHRIRIAMVTISTAGGRSGKSWYGLSGAQFIADVFIFCRFIDTLAYYVDRIDMSIKYVDICAFYRHILEVLPELPIGRDIISQSSRHGCKQLFYLFARVLGRIKDQSNFHRPAEGGAEDV